MKQESKSSKLILIWRKISYYALNLVICCIGNYINIRWRSEYGSYYRKISSDTAKYYAIRQITSY